MRILLATLTICILVILPVHAAQIKELNVVATPMPIKLDGELSEAVWKTAPIAQHFTQNAPNTGKASAFRSEVQVLYDKTGVYIGATLYDAHPDSILRELGTRDAGEINTDLFGVAFDTYNDDQNAFEFIVSASGTQTDMRQSNNGSDANWNAVWENVVKITEEGWVVEMKIPYSALRFPDKPEQTWGINFMRLVRRVRERSYWNPIDPAVQGYVNQFGQLTGIKDIKPPLRLAFFPYVSYYAIHDGYNNAWSHTPRGGADVKYGINESFTLDMTLVPDFGQVQSDNIVYNLSPFEVRFDEYRQFFTEGTELFNKGDLFYSRRVGGRPIDFYKIYNSLSPGDKVISNPSSSQLINATKISGRTEKKLGIGFFNAASAPTHAVIEDKEGNTRKMLTSPLTNYNMIVLDQPFLKNSFVSLINTNVMREGSFRDANVTALMTKFADKSNNWMFTGNGTLSQAFMKNTATGQKNELGYAYDVSFGKNNGRFNFFVQRTVTSNTYNPNDLGYLSNNSAISNSASVSWRQFEPKGILNRMANTLSAEYAQYYTNKQYMSFKFMVNGFYLFKNFFAAGYNGEIYPFAVHDYFATRVPGKYVKLNAGAWLDTWISTDYRKKIAIDANGGYFASPTQQTSSVWFGFSPRYRVNNHLTISYNAALDMPINEVGFANLDADNEPVFGRRDVKTIINTMTTVYNFTRRMSLSLRFRHYSLSTKYKEYYALNNDGTWTVNPTYPQSEDLSFNAFNVDMVYAWEFTTGSQLSIVWKNAISDFKGQYIPSYFGNIRQTFEAPQVNSLSVKVVYYLDALMFRRKTQG